MTFSIGVLLMLLVGIGMVLKFLRGVIRLFIFSCGLIIFAVVLYYLVDTGVYRVQGYMTNALEQTTNEIYGWDSFTSWIHEKWIDIKLSIF